jgi:protein O-GlcNAc transferase
MDEKNSKISILFIEKKYEELIFFLETEFKNKSSQILNLLGVCRLFNGRDKKSLMLALQEFKQAYIQEKKTQFGLEALINFINTAVDLHIMQSPVDDTLNDSSIYLNQTNEPYDEAKYFFGYNERLVSAIIRAHIQQANLDKILNGYKTLFDHGNLDLYTFSSWIYFNNYKKNWSQKDYFKYTKLLQGYVEKLPENKLVKIRRKEGGKIKIGFLSSDILKKHSVTYFLKTVFLNYDQDKFEIYLYLDNKIEDDNTNEFKVLVKKTFNISDLEDVDAINLIRKDEIDIMFDIMGLSSVRRISLFKNRLAPKQISWLGYCNTTGIDNMDYLIADANLIHPKEECNYVEKIIYLPNIWNCHSELSADREEIDLPCLQNKYITFGSFNNFNKINDNVIYVWSQILKNLAGSKLILKSSSKIDKSYIEKRFIENGISDSVIFLEKRKLNKHFILYRQIDIALDTFPYNGVTTSFEAISMGVPVLTMKGYNFNSRCGESIIKNLGVKELIAKDEDEYIFKAKKLAEDQERLFKIRKQIFKTAPQSPLFNKKIFASDFFNCLENI